MVRVRYYLTWRKKLVTTAVWPDAAGGNTFWQWLVKAGVREALEEKLLSRLPELSRRITAAPLPAFTLVVEYAVRLKVAGVRREEDSYVFRSVEVLDLPVLHVQLYGFSWRAFIGAVKRLAGGQKSRGVGGG